jgi:hypothetical protein
MQVAEDVVTDKKCDQPLAAAQITDSFKYLMPSAALLQVKSDKLYRHHCDELIDRIVDGGDPDFPTRAELCSYFCYVSLKAPLNNDWAFVYWTLFKEIYPDADIDGEHLHESWPGRSREILSDATKRLTVQRFIPEPKKDQQLQLFAKVA